MRAHVFASALIWRDFCFGLVRLVFCLAQRTKIKHFTQKRLSWTH
jgi:hypothetical protein